MKWIKKNWDYLLGAAGLLGLVLASAFDWYNWFALFSGILVFAGFLSLMFNRWV